MAQFRPGVRLFESVPVENVGTEVFAVRIAKIQVWLVQKKADPLDAFDGLTRRSGDFPIQLLLSHIGPFREG